jgi:hypothetical protein|tara:strand:- start:694 stop:885 length:192 start_codon:yes stop_codon:yes gene_type:complete
VKSIDDKITDSILKNKNQPLAALTKEVIKTVKRHLREEEKEIAEHYFYKENIIKKKQIKLEMK